MKLNLGVFLAICNDLSTVAVMMN